MTLASLKRSYLFLNTIFIPFHFVKGDIQAMVLRGCGDSPEGGRAETQNLHLKLSSRLKN